MPSDIGEGCIMNTSIHTNQLHLNPNFGFALADSVVLAEAKVNISHPEGKMPRSWKWTRIAS